MDYCKIEESLEFSRISINYFSLLDHLVTIIEVISDAVLTQMVKGISWRQRNKRKEERGNRENNNLLKNHSSCCSRNTSKVMLHKFWLQPNWSLHIMQNTPLAAAEGKAALLWCVPWFHFKDYHQPIFFLPLATTYPLHPLLL